MRVSTIMLCDLVLQEDGIRAAARRSGAPPSTVTAALQRLEAELSIPLVRRSGGKLAFSIQSEQMRSALTRLAVLCCHVYGQPPDQAIRAAQERPVTLEALFRLAEVLRAGSIRKAALHMNIGQPQLTRDLGQLEQRLGRALLLRDRRGVSATDIGIALLDIIEELQGLWTAISKTADNRFMRNLRGKSLGSVIPLGAQSEVAEVVSRMSVNWLRRYKVPLFVASATAEELLTGLDDGRYDAVLLDSAPDEPRYRVTPILTARLALYGQALPASLDSPELAKVLAQNPLALQSLRSGLRQKTTQFLDDFFGPDWRQQFQLMEIDSVPITLNMVVNHGVISVLPAAVSPPEGHRLHSLILPDTYLQTLALISRPDPQSQRFIQQLQELS